MKDHPILFNSAMVRAILEGRKTQTRRIVKPQSAVLTDAMARSLQIQPPTKENQAVIPCPYGRVGDRLWVRETWRPAITDSESLIQYKADGDLREISPSIYLDEEWFLKAAITEGKWRPSIHMPRWASRITLEITGIRVERVKEIREADGRNRLKKQLQHLEDDRTDAEVEQDARRAEGDRIQWEPEE